MLADWVPEISVLPPTELTLTPTDAPSNGFVVGLDWAITPDAMIDIATVTSIFFCMLLPLIKSGYKKVQGARRMPVIGWIELELASQVCLVSNIA
jgi:hypothetical protein